MRSSPQVSIILPMRDAAETIGECLASIAGQTLSDIEIIIIDDGSSDGSRELVARWMERDDRICLLTPGRAGLVRALNLGIERARAPYAARMDADDVMHPERLELQASFLDGHPEIGVVGSQVELFPEELIADGYREYVRWLNGCTEPEEIAANIFVESPLAHPSVMMRRSLIEEIGGYRDGDFPEDYELWLRIHYAGWGMAKIPRVLLRWRERHDRTSRVDTRYARTAFDALRARYLADDERLRTGRPLVIWGAGRKTRLRVRHLIEQGARPIAWIDIDPKKIGNNVWGIPVHPPAWLLNAEPMPFVLIYVANHGAREEIESYLHGTRYRRSRDYLAVG